MAVTDQAVQGDAFPCQNCGAKLHYDAGSQGLRCPYCGHQQAVAAAAPGAATREIPIEEGLRLAQRGLGAPVTQVHCNDCGATVNVSPGEQTAKCAFCGSHQVLPRESSGQEIRPESLLPFKVDKAGANGTFEKWLAGLWFRPSDLKRMAKVQEMGGVYIPFWTFDAQVYSQWRAEAGYYYQETEYYTDQQGNRQSRQVTKTRWQHASGHRNDFFDDTIVCASKGLPAELVDRFKTFRTAELVPYQPQYLAGWKAESYVLDLMPAWQKGQDVMGGVQRSRCAGDVPGDTHRSLEVHNSFSRVTFKHVLLPVWIAAYRYGGKPYQFLVNGQTGEVVGKAPYSFWKIFFFVLGIVAVVVVLALVFGGGSGGGKGKPSGSGKRRSTLDVASPALCLRA
jgi:DNA-directed RNA polymerase subunit RPC12/RpoP